MAVSFIIGLIVFISILLVVVILAQNAKGGGLSSQFGGSSASNIIGVKKTGDLLEKLTWGFIFTIMALVLATALFDGTTGRSGNDLFDKVNEEGNVSAPAGEPLPAQPADSTPQ
jgi:preprotein translocase subunit SecG